MPYTSGMISSYGKFAQQPGWFEIRCEVAEREGDVARLLAASGDKTWPPEIDILEILGHEPDKVYMTNHWATEPGSHEGNGKAFKGPDFSAGYHTFALDWSKDALVWYVDGVERFRTTENVPHVPMYILANLAVGGDWPGMQNADTQFPGYMDTDYIAVIGGSDSPNPGPLP